MCVFIVLVSTKIECCRILSNHFLKYTRIDLVVNKLFCLNFWWSQFRNNFTFCLSNNKIPNFIHLFEQIHDFFSWTVVSSSNNYFIKQHKNKSFLYKIYDENVESVIKIWWLPQLSLLWLSWIYIIFILYWNSYVSALFENTYINLLLFWLYVNFLPLVNK